MNKKAVKIFSLIVLSLLAIMIITNFAYAVDPKSIIGDTKGDGITEITSAGKKIVGIIQTIGSVVAVAILVVLGIKYMLGSTEEKAEYKKTLIPYIIGAVLIFAASNIAGIAYSWAQGIGN